MKCEIKGSLSVIVMIFASLLVSDVLSSIVNSTITTTAPSVKPTKLVGETVGTVSKGLKNTNDTIKDDNDNSKEYSSVSKLSNLSTSNKSTDNLSDKDTVNNVTLNSTVPINEKTSKTKEKTKQRNNQKNKNKGKTNKVPLKESIPLDTKLNIKDKEIIGKSPSNKYDKSIITSTTELISTVLPPTVRSTAKNLNPIGKNIITHPTEVSVIANTTSIIVINSTEEPFLANNSSTTPEDDWVTEPNSDKTQITEEVSTGHYFLAVFITGLVFALIGYVSKYTMS